MRGYGFDQLLYGFTRYRSATSFGDPADCIVLTGYPKDYVTDFVASGHIYHAPMVRWALENEGACSWRRIREMLAADELSPRAKEVLAFKARYGINAGISISFGAVSAPSARFLTVRVCRRTMSTPFGTRMAPIFLS